MIHYSILICALNEEKNIENLLSEIFNAQKEETTSFLDKVVVISDGSIDKTSEIVISMQSKYKNLFLIENTKRIGKALSFNKGKKEINSDWLISFDADIQISKELFVELFRGKLENIGLIGGNPIPLQSKNTVGSMSALFSYILVDRIKKSIKSGNNFYSAHGRCLALSKEIYTNIELIDSAGTDQFMYFYTLTKGKSFLFQESAKVYYNLPNISKDYLKQNIRFQNTNNTMENHFGKEIVSKEKYIPLKIKINSLITSFIGNPYKGMSWFLMFSIGKIKSYFSQSSTGKWEVSSSTK